MEKLRKAVKRIAYTPPSTCWLTTLPPLHLSLIPLLSLVSSVYSIAIRVRRHLYRFGLLRTHRLPLPVISVGNLTWGGNGKTPMVEFLSRALADCGISPLILTRGYGGADEAKMLKRQLRGTVAKIGHLTLHRDLEIVMVNALMPWGNHHLLPLGPLREPLTALNRADIIVIHHADLVPENDISSLESTIQQVRKSSPIFSTKMTPTHFFSCHDVSCKISLTTIDHAILLCLSGIGFADSFVKNIERLVPAYVDHLDFSDHHQFNLKDIEMVRTRLQALESKFAIEPIVVVTEKDYDRSPEVLKHLKPYEVLVLCCRLQFLGSKGGTEDRFKKIMKEHLCHGLSRSMCKMSTLPRVEVLTNKSGHRRTALWLARESS